MNNDVLIKILTKIYSVFGENIYKYDILSTEIRDHGRHRPQGKPHNIITISYKCNEIPTKRSVLYTDYSNELQKLRDNKIEILLN